MSRMRFLSLLAVASLVAACSSGSSPASGPVSDVNATLKEWEFNLDATTGAEGEVTFHIQNDGDKTHEFVVVSTDTAADSLPVDESTDTVDETQFTPVDEVEDITSGSSAELAVTLAPGHYVILCNLEGHYAKGMAADFTVE